MAAGTARLPTAQAALIADNAGTWRAIGTNADGMLYVHPCPGFQVTQDLALNDSDKTFTVPAAHIWVVHWIFVNYTAHSTVGSRELIADILDDAANTIGRVGTGTIITASQQQYCNLLGSVPQINDSTQFTIGARPDAPLTLPASYQLRVYDLAAISTLNDDMLVSIGHQELDNT